MARTSKTQVFLAQIHANVDEWYERRISYKDFQARQRCTWDAIERSGPRMTQLVLDALRPLLPTCDAPEGPCVQHLDDAKGE